MAHVANVTIQSSQVSADLTDYIVYIDLSDLPSSFWDVVANGGGDIRVFKEGGSVELAREVVSCDTGTDTGELYVKYSGTLSSSVDTVIEIHADGTSSDYAVGATYGRNAVWTDYSFVAHGEIVGGALIDSSGNGNYTALGTPSHTPGKLGNAAQLNGTTDYFTRTANVFNSSSLTISVWYNIDAFDSTDVLFIFPDATLNGLFDNWIQQNTAWRFGLRNTSGTRVFYDGLTAVSTGAWQMLHAVYDGAEMAIYLDSVLDDDRAHSGTINDGTRTKYIGSSAGVDRFIDGLLDEIRFRKSSISTAWRNAEYTNQHTPATFYSTEAVSDGGVESERAATVHGQATATSTRAAKTTGTSETSANSSRAAKTTGVNTGNSSRAAKLEGEYNSNTWLIEVNVDGGGWTAVEGSIVVDPGADAYIYYDETTTFVNGSEYCYRVKNLANDTGYSNIDCFVYSDGGTNVSSARSASLHGVDTATSARAAKTHGTASTTSTRSAKVQGVSSDTSNRSAKAAGSSTSSDNRSAKTHGQGTTSATRAAKVEGAEGAAFATRAAKTHGTASTTSTRAAKVQGVVPTEVDSERSAKVVGVLAASASRSARVTGVAAGRTDPYCPIDTPYTRYQPRQC